MYYMYYIKRVIKSTLETKYSFSFLFLLLLFSDQSTRKKAENCSWLLITLFCLLLENPPFQQMALQAPACENSAKSQQYRSLIINQLLRLNILRNFTQTTIIFHRILGEVCSDFKIDHGIMDQILLQLCVQFVINSMENKKKMFNYGD